MQALSGFSGGPDVVLKEVDDALSEVHAQGHSKSSIRKYLKGHIYLCLGNGTWHPSRSALSTYIQAYDQKVPRGLAKEFKFAKLFLVKCNY